MRGDVAWCACEHALGHPAMPNAYLLGENNLLFQKKKPSFFWEITPNLWARQPRPVHATAKAKVAPMGMLPRPGHANKAKIAHMGT